MTTNQQSDDYPETSTHAFNPHLGVWIHKDPDNAPLNDCHYAAYVTALDAINNADAETFYHFGDLRRALMRFMGRYWDTVKADESFVCSACVGGSDWGCMDCSGVDARGVGCRCLHS